MVSPKTSTNNRANNLLSFLVGEPVRLMSLTKNWISARPSGGPGSALVPSDVDDAFAAVLEFESGALGTLEASRFARGRKNYNRFEINGERGSLAFNLERLNELEVYWQDEDPRETRGFHDVLITEPLHPYLPNWWPDGHILGWEHSFVHEFHHFFDAIVNDQPVAPYGATFEDGYRNAVICDAILESARTGRQVDVRF